VLAFAALVAATTVAGRAHADEAAAGRAAIARFGCPSCHAVPGFTPDRENGCVACHVVVAKRPRSALRGSPPITHYVRVPDLMHVTARLRGDWLVAFVQDPHDVRPHLEESMPRLPVGPAEARAIVTYLRARTAPSRPVAPGPPLDDARVPRGREVFRTAGCPSCHVFGNVDFESGATEELYRGMREQALLAPNLRFVRERLDPTVALAWIRDPTSIDPRTSMPRPAISDADAIALRDFLFLADPGPVVRPPPAPRAADLPPLDRAVRFAEVRRVFGRSCIHCHAHTNSLTATAALGFRPLGLDLSTREGVIAGSLAPDGSRRSVVEPRDGRPSILLERLLTRYAEAPRDTQRVFRDSLGPGLRRRAPAPTPVGMPLGLPALSLGELRLIATWLAQAAPP
jgi:mono/diheme cytochrome c family protein